MREKAKIETVAGRSVILTPEMIEAGAVALSEYWNGYENLEEAAERIFKAMVAARPSA
ncbi:MAG TPA: hypothetical protein VNF28_02005 [Candidatus Binataceae bacterium]|nr:hypothetical protein [Candidatus Binataceae bacterium]